MEIYAFGALGFKNVNFDVVTYAASNLPRQSQLARGEVDGVMSEIKNRLELGKWTLDQVLENLEPKEKK